MKKTLEDKLWLVISAKVNKYFDPSKGACDVYVEQGPYKPHKQVFESIEHYTKQTGKRFRMTKCQKDRQLTREQAFNETHKN
jgi:hypothetical protein